MTSLYPDIEAYARGMLDVGDGQLVSWMTCGNPDGKPAVVLHGGPGSGASTWWARFFDPTAYRIVVFDQRGCGNSTPSAADPATDLSVNTPERIIADIELLREHLGIDTWLVFGGSWGSALGLAYAQAHPERVSELILFSVTANSRREIEWITRDMGRIFPEEWARFRNGVPPADRDGNLPDAYARLLADPDPAVRDKAARDWCEWEDTHVATAGPRKHDPRYDDPTFRMVFARLVTHHWRNAWPDGQVLGAVDRLAGIPGVLVHGRLDVSSPLDIAWLLAQAWKEAELVVIDEAGHGAGHTDMKAALVAATDRFAGR